MWIKWSETADNDLAEILSYSDIGNNIVHGILKSVNRLVDYPLLGRQGRIADTRELVNTAFPYVVIYKITNDVVKIMRVIHTSRLFPKKL